MEKNSDECESTLNIYTSRLIFFVNGVKVVEDCVDPAQTLLQYLRNALGLTGSKLGCSEGGCGACTVMVSYYNHISHCITHIAVNACLMPVASVHGMAVTTVEGIGSTKTKLHAVQERLAKCHGSQCGFCTPGIVMSMYTLLRNNALPSSEEVESTFQGNLCRCTGYRPILEGFNTFTKDFASCCKNKKGGACCMESGDTGCTSAHSAPEKFAPYDPKQELIFPSELQVSDELNKEFLRFELHGNLWFRPVTVDQLFELKCQFPKAKLVVGNTEVGLEVKFKHFEYPVLISVSSIPQLCEMTTTENGVRIGASCTLSAINKLLTALISELPDSKTKVLLGIVEMLKWFAGSQIRNVASIGGNIVTASPISDLVPILMAAKATLEMQSKQRGSRTVVLDEHFLKGYRKIDMGEDEVLISVTVPFSGVHDHFDIYKQSQRREDDIAIVNAAMMASFEPEGNVISDIRLAFGGMAPTTVLAVKTMSHLKGKPWDDDMFQLACEKLVEDLPLPAGSPGGKEKFRKTLCASFFYKFYLSVKKDLEEKCGHCYSSKIPRSHLQATAKFSREPSRGIQIFQESEDEDGCFKAVGKSMVHAAATKQATGEAKYIDDMPPYSGELYLGLVTSTKAHANILSVDIQKALALPGVHCYVGYEDVPGSNNFGEICADDLIFAKDTVTCQGQVIGGIVATSQDIAQKAARFVSVKYEELPVVITIEQAIKEQQFFPYVKSIKKGDLEKSFAACDHIIEGETRTGAQEHFYLETNGSIAMPKGEHGEMEMYVSTQNLAKAQLFAAKALGVAANRITVRTKRLGGGFGGKETRCFCVSLAACVAAHKVNRPVRCVLDRDEDMLITGTRHPYLGRYKVGFNSDGKILALEATFYANAGNTVDMSPATLERAVMHATNVYHIPTVHVTGYCCKTNIPSNTAFRGFGAPQAMFVCESWMNDVAVTLNMPSERVREVNLFRDGDITHYNQVLENYLLDRCWYECAEQSKYHKRRDIVNAFNRDNRWKKRGLVMIPTGYGISFTLKFMNQAGCLINIYTDGSVLLAHGGVEMGQGLHTKMIQVAAQTLGIPHSYIHISESNTSTVPNASATAASVSSDLNGYAILNACQILLQRLEPYKKQNPDGSWEEWIKAAYFDRVSLSTTGFYKTPDIGYDIETNSGKCYNYFTCGVACTEVEIDCLTGDHVILKTDIVMDLGKSLNPSIDIGQIEGAFVQGYGLFTMEEQLYRPDGSLLTRGPSNYKIPGFTDIPIEFNVSLLKGVGNPRAVYSSKAIGEPALFLGASVLFAIKEAVMAARSDSGLSGVFRLDAPATCERIRMACMDELTCRFDKAEPAEGSFTPWTVQL